jgi:hypothetical protein
MKAISTVLFLLFISTQPVRAAEVGVAGTYNTVTKKVSPTVTISERVNNLTFSGWVNFAGSTYKPGSSSYYKEAAYTIQDAKERFNIVAPSNYTSPDVSGSLYSWDGTRLDGQVISGQDSEGQNVYANRTATADLQIIEAKPETAGISYGADIKVDVYKDYKTLAKLGVGLKLGNKVTPYITTQVDTTLADAISFFADVKVPMDSSGIDVSSGIKIQF